MTKQKESATGRRWRLFQVETSLACTLQCLMCPWKGDRRDASPGGLMPAEVWEAIRPCLSEVSSVDFTGGGEPLLHPRLGEWIAEASSCGCETGFLTSGLLLNPKKEEEVLEAGVDWVGISIDGATAEVYEGIRKGSDFRKVCGNVLRLSSGRKKGVPRIMVNFVLMRNNVHQAEELVRLAGRLGVDQVNFKQCDVVRGNEGRGLGVFSAGETEETRRVGETLDRARALAKSMGIRTSSFSLAPEELPVCEQDPCSSLFVRHDGAVAPCINLAFGGASAFLGRDVVFPTVVYGALPAQKVQDLWKSPTCEHYRHVFGLRREIYEREVLRRLRGAAFDRERILQRAKSAMPAAPAGCRTCHYLFDV